MSPVPHEARSPVHCPWCGEPFVDRVAFEAHAAREHEHRRPTRPARTTATRFRRWVHGLGYLPLWFVLPVNACLVALLVSLWHDDLGPYLVGDPTDAGSWLKTWILRLSLLPTVLVLAARIFDRRVD